MALYNPREITRRRRIANLATTAGALAATNQLTKGIKNPYAKLGAMAVGGLISGGIGGCCKLLKTSLVLLLAKDRRCTVNGTIKDAKNQAEVMQILGGAAMQPYVQANIKSARYGNASD